MGYLALGEIFENMLQLKPFRIYLEEILNEYNGYFHIEIMLSVSHMLSAVRMPFVPLRKL